MYDDHHAISADSHHDGDPIAGSHTADTIEKDFLLHEVSDAAKAQNNGTVTKDEYDNFIEFLVHIRVLLDGVDLSHDESISGATSTLIQIVDEIQVPNLGHFASHTVLSAIEALWHAGHCYYLISLFVLYAHAEDLHGHLESLISVLGDVSNVTAGSPPTVDGSDDGSFPSLERPSSGDGGDASTAAADLDPASLFPTFLDYSDVPAPQQHTG